MIVRIVLLTDRAAEHFGLLGGLRAVCAGEQAAGRNAVVDERLVVRAPGEVRADVRLVVLSEVVGEDLLELGRALGDVDIIGDRNVGPIGVERADDEVVRTDHVEVHIGLDLAQLGLAEAFDVFRRADETDLFGTPPAEADGIIDLGRLLGQSLGRGQEGRRAGTVVIGPGAFGHTVEVGAEHLHIVMVAGLGLGDDVPGRRGDELGLQGEVGTRGLALGRLFDLGEQVVADIVGGGHGRGAVVDPLAEGGVEFLVGIVGVVVVDDEPRGPGIGGSLGLLTEGAGPADGEHERALGGLVVVRGLAAELSAGQIAVVIIDRQHHGQIGQRLGGALRQAGRSDLELLAVDADLDGVERLLFDLEGLPLDVEGAGGLEGRLDVLHGLFIAGSAQGPEALVGMGGGDIGDLLQMLHHGTAGDAHISVFGRSGGSRRRGRVHPAQDHAGRGGGRQPGLRAQLHGVPFAPRSCRRITWKARAGSDHAVWPFTPAPARSTALWGSSILTFRHDSSLVTNRFFYNETVTQLTLGFNLTHIRGV